MLRDDVYVAEHDRFEVAYEAEVLLESAGLVRVDEERPVDVDGDGYDWETS